MRHLAAVPAPAAPVPVVLLCGHCAHRPALPRPSRVCPSCALGLVLPVAADGAPGPADAFLLVDDLDRVVGASRAAEAALGAPEPALVGRALTAVLAGRAVDRVVTAGPPPVRLVVLGA